MFQVAHVVGDVRFFQLSAEGKVNMGWGESQLYSSADFAHGSFFWTHFSGGLNYQAGRTKIKIKPLATRTRSSYIQFNVIHILDHDAVRVSIE